MPCQLLTAPELISARFLQFYRELYSSKVAYDTIKLTHYLDQIPFPTLDLNRQCELDISLEEIQEAMGGMQSGKAPGLDGIPIEFYSTYQELLAPRNTFLLG